MAHPALEGFFRIHDIKSLQEWYHADPPLYNLVQPKDSIKDTLWGKILQKIEHQYWCYWRNGVNGIVRDYALMEDLLHRVALVEFIPQIGLEEWFNRTKAMWALSTRHLSSINLKGDHPAYDAIIAQGMLIVPVILTSFLKNGPDHFFVALHEITGANPVPKKHAGKINVMAYYWILWGIEYWIDFQKRNKLIFVDFTELAIMAGGSESIKNPENSPALKRLMP